MFDVVKWWVVAVAVAVGLVGGFAACYFGIASTANNTVRQLESRLTDAQDTSRRVASENQQLRSELERVEGIGREIADDNKRLAKRTVELSNENKRLIDGLNRSVEDIRGINDLGDDIAETVARIIGIVGELERVYQQVGK